MHSMNVKTNIDETKGQNINNITPEPSFQCNFDHKVAMA